MSKLILKNVSKYYGKKKVIDDTSFQFDSGIYGIIGRNGAGKTTILKIITSIIEDYQGEILFGQDHITNDSYRDIIGYMPQHQDLIPYMSVNRFLLYFASLKNIEKKLAKERIANLLEELNLKNVQNDKISTLSGGMKQRVLLAQALLNDPKLIFLDEPTTGLDPIERKNFRNFINSLSADKIIIITTHIISDLEYIAEKILVMDAGKIVISGTQEEILKKTYVSEITFSTTKDFKESDYNILNIKKSEKGIVIRYLSSTDDSNRVPSNLDDVFIRWVD